MSAALNGEHSVAEGERVHGGGRKGARWRRKRNGQLHLLRGGHGKL